MSVLLLISYMFIVIRAQPSFKKNLQINRRPNSMLKDMRDTFKIRQKTLFETGPRLLIRSFLHVGLLLTANTE